MARTGTNGHVAVVAKPDKTGHLSEKQRRAIAGILLGYTDAMVANSIDVSRQTVNGWRNHHPAFIAELNRQRQEIWDASIEQLRGLVCRAVDTVDYALRYGELHKRAVIALQVLRGLGVLGSHLSPKPLPPSRGEERAVAGTNQIPDLLLERLNGSELPVIDRI